MKTMVILRGVSGSGKSTVAEYLRDISWNNSSTSIRTADQYFERDGLYAFNAADLGKAHQWCIDHVESDMINEFGQVIVANTSTTEKELKPYLELAAKYNYKVISLVVENRHGNQNVHGVPDETLKKQESRLRNSIKLI